MNDWHSGEWTGFGILAFIGIWWLGWLFTRGMAAARKSRALRTGDGSGLTLEDKQENRAEFISEMAKPDAPAKGSPMETAKACWLLGWVLLGVGVVVLFATDGDTPFHSLLLGAGVLMLMLGGAVAIGGSK